MIWYLNRHYALDPLSGSSSGALLLDLVAVHPCTVPLGKGAQTHETSLLRCAAANHAIGSLVPIVKRLPAGFRRPVAPRDEALRSLRQIHCTFIEFDFNDSWGLQGEVLFSQTNTELRDSYQSVWNDKFEKKKTLNYVSVPVLLKYNPSGLISLHAGPQFSFLANRDQSTWENGEKLFKDTDFSLVAGAEVNLGPLFAYGRYVWGYSDISNALKEKATTQQIQLGVGVRF